MPTLTAVAISVDALRSVLMSVDNGGTWALMPVGGNTPVTFEGDGLGNVDITITAPED